MPTAFRDTRDLEDRLSQPHEATIDVLREITGDILLLGAGGKMGTSLATMARRASDSAGLTNRVIAASRFSDPQVRKNLQGAGVETQQGDLLDPQFVSSLPECENVVYMVGQKFGTSSAPEATWATNAFLPGLVCQKFSKSRIACFSTGNVYPLVPVESGGSQESDELRPCGEYAMSAVARERVLQYFSQTLEIPAVILRLNYATEMRYGVLVDLARKVMQEEAISLATGYFNCIWQGDANNMTLRSLAHTETPARTLNLTGPVVRVQDVCGRFEELFDKTAIFTGAEEPTALLSNAAAACELLGPPQVTLEDMIAWRADWIANNGETRSAPTHFEARDGKF